MKTPAHADIELHAYRLWLDQGCPEGQAGEHWQQAESALTSTPDATDDDSATQPGGHPPGMIAAEELVRRQRDEARSADSPRKGTTERRTPAATGKPIWPTPHSS